MDDKPFVSLSSLADRTGLPAWWLKIQASEGLIPFLLVGKRQMFNVQAVESAIASRSNGDRKGIDQDQSKAQAAGHEVCGAA